MGQKHYKIIDVSLSLSIALGILKSNLRLPVFIRFTLLRTDRAGFFIKKLKVLNLTLDKQDPRALKANLSPDDYERLRDIYETALEKGSYFEIERMKLSRYLLKEIPQDKSAYTKSARKKKK